VKDMAAALRLSENEFQTIIEAIAPCFRVKKECS
jgi:hypothetical protein